MNTRTLAAPADLPQYRFENLPEVPRADWAGLLAHAALAIEGRAVHDAQSLAAQLRGIAFDLQRGPAVKQQLSELHDTLDHMTLAQERLNEMEALFAAIRHESADEEGRRIFHLSGIGLDLGYRALEDLCEPVKAMQQKSEAMRAELGL